MYKPAVTKIVAELPGAQTSALEFSNNGIATQLTGIDANGNAFAAGQYAARDNGGLHLTVRVGPSLSVVLFDEQGAQIYPAP